MVQLIKQDEQTLIKEIQIYKRPLNIGNENIKQFLSLVATDACHYFCVAQTFNNNKYILEYDKKNDFQLQRVNDLKIYDYHELLVDVKSNQFTQKIKLIDLVDKADAKSSYFVLNNNCILCVNRIIKFLNSIMKPGQQKIKLACLVQIKFILNFVKKQISYILAHFRKSENFNKNSIKYLIKDFKLDQCFKNFFIKNFVTQIISDFLARQNHSFKDILSTFLVFIVLIFLSFMIKNSIFYMGFQMVLFFSETFTIILNRNLDIGQKILKISNNFLYVCFGFIPVLQNIFSDILHFCNQFLSIILNQFIEGEMELNFDQKIGVGLATIFGILINTCIKPIPVILSCSAGLSVALTAAVGGIVGAGLCFAGIKLYDKIYGKE